VYVTRADGTSTGWDFPSYGDGLPHDLCHLVVEEELKLSGGFWGLIDQGFEIAVVNGEGALLHNGRPLHEEAGSALSSLIEAEAAVADLAGPATGPDSLADPTVGVATRAAPGGARDHRDPGRPSHPPARDPEAVDAIHRRLRQITEQWRDLNDGAAIVLEFDRSGLGWPILPDERPG